MWCVNPSTEESREVVEFPRDKISIAIQKLRRESHPWRKQAACERVKKLSGLPGALEKNKEILAKTIGLEMGKPWSLAKIEVERTIDEVLYLLGHATEWLCPEQAPEGIVEFAPLGVAAVIAPWNFPLLIPMRGILPALLAGNGVVFKPSELTPETGRFIEQIVTSLDPIFREIFLLILGGKEHGQTVVSSEVDVIAFTGSTAAGKHIARVAAERLTRLVLELGGLDAAVVLADADIEMTAKAIVQSNTANSGQVCNAVKRVFVESAAYEALVANIVACVEKLRVDIPERDPDLGPLVSEVQLRRVESFVLDAKEKGARILTGGKRRGENGFFFSPTVIVGVDLEMRLMNEEAFGPVLPIMPVRDWQEAVQRTNDTRFGLSASVWTGNFELAQTIAEELEVGMVGVNSHRAGRSGCPWGGAKESGIGRMKTREGLREFTNVKFVRSA